MTRKFLTWLSLNKTPSLCKRILTSCCELACRLETSAKRIQMQTFHSHSIRKGIDSSCNINQTVLENVTSIKDLGVFLDQKLTFETHIHATVSKANHALGLLIHTFQSASRRCNFNRHCSGHLQHQRSTNSRVPTVRLSEMSSTNSSRSL